MTTIPPRILDQLKGAIVGLHDIARRLEENRAMDQRLGSAGRYESEAYANRAGDIAGWRDVLDKFAAVAAAKGIETEAIYAGFGGVPELHLSPVAQSYVDGSKPQEQEGER